jgi:transcriptional regulator with XRE-family HTH domain
MSREELADASNRALAERYGHDQRSQRAQRRQWAGLTISHIGSYERGENRWPNEDYRWALCKVLGATEADLGFYIDRPERINPPSRAVHFAGTGIAPHREIKLEPATDLKPSTHGLETHQDPAGRDDVDHLRRALLGGLAAVAAAAGLSGGAQARAPRQIGLPDVARLEAMTDLYRSFDYEQGGGALYEQVADLAESATWFLEAKQRDDVFAKLTTALAGVRQLAGWTAFDAGRYADSQRHFLIAERAAVAGGDRPVVARIRYCQARQFQHQRHNTDALHTVRYAQDQLGTAGTPAVNAMLYGAQAASLAALGDHDLAIKALGRAQDAYEQVDPDREPSWMRFYDYGELLAQYGRVYRDLARTDRRFAPAAVEYVTRAVANFGPTNVRSTVLNQVGLCSAWFLAGEPDQALAMGAEVIHLSGQLTSQRILERITNIRRDIGQHRRRSDVADFAHVLAGIAA